MNATRAEGYLSRWATPQCPFTIDYVPQVLQDIGLAVVEAFHSLAHGGVEIGGILLGSYSGKGVAITGYKALECEHAFGPSFQLSSNDGGHLLDLMVSTQLTGEAIVGWYHSHTRSEILLSEADLAIYDRYFSDPRHVALVMKPYTLDPVRCGFFFREADGKIHRTGTYREFELERVSLTPAPMLPRRGLHSLAAVTAISEVGVPARQPATEPPSRQEPRKASAALGAHAYYTWSFLGAPVCIRLHFEVVSALQDQLKQPTELHGAGKTELRGILLGRVDASGSTIISDFRTLSGIDENELEAKLAALKGSDTRPVGFYRIHADEKLCLSEEDLRIARVFFPHPTDVFLVINPSHIGPANAAFFFWEKGQIVEFSFMEFPFDAESLAAGELGRMQGAAERRRTAVDAAESQPQETRETAEALPGAGLRRRRPAALVLATILLLATGTAFVLLNHWNRGSTPPLPDAALRPSLGLKIQREGADVVLTWDRNALSTLGATAGLLSIKDGSIQKEIGLNAEQLRSANTLFSPQSDQVEIQLTVLLPNQRTASESGIAILQAQRFTGAVVVDKPAAAATANTSPPAKVASEPARVRVVDTPAATANTSPPAQVASEPARVRGDKKFVPPPSQISGSPRPLTDAPPVRIGAEPTLPMIPDSSVMPAPTSPSVVPNLPPPAAEHGTESRPAGSATPYTPPIPIRQVGAVTPRELRSVIGRPITVAVKVTIDQNGNVVKAEPVAKQAVHAMLIDAATRAAGLFKFRPARQDNQAVPSEIVLLFRFDPVHL